MSLKNAGAILLLLLFAVGAVRTAHAQTVSARGMGSVTWEGWRLGSEERQLALQRAKLSAVETHLAETSPQRVRLFANRRDELAANIDRYVLAATVLDESEDKKAHRFAIVVRADINGALLQADLDAGAATTQIPTGDRSVIAMVFLARSQDSVKSFDDRVYERTTATAEGRVGADLERRTHEGEQILPASIDTVDSAHVGIEAQADATATRTTGGSTTRKAAKVQWKVTTTNEATARMAGVLGLSGYEIVEGEYVEAESGGKLSLEKIRRDFSAGNDLSPAVMRATVDGVRAAGIPLLALGTMDVGVRDIDPTTGNTRVYVTVTGRVLDLSGRFPRTVSSVGPVQFAGLGPSEMVARNNALSLAAEQAAQKMADELNLRGVR